MEFQSTTLKFLKKTFPFPGFEKAALFACARMSV